MRDFSQLLDGLVYTRSRNAKLKLIADYLRRTPDPDRGWAMAALTGEVDLPAVKAAAIKGIVDERVDPVLFAMSRDFVGDLAETAALLWPKPIGQPAELDDGSLRIGAVVERLRTLGRAEAPRALAQMLDHLDSSGRYALLKLATGELRVGVSARLAKTALAQAFDLDVDAVEEVWHGIRPPYAELFAWGTGRGAQPTAADVPVFRPFMLAHPLEDGTVDLADYAAEWKWDGIRVQLVHVGGETRLYSRAGDDITRSFPDVAAAFRTPGVLDGELLVRGEHQGGRLEEGGGAASFNALQQRLGRKQVSAKMLEDYPAFVRLYDILFDGGEDLRALGWTERRARLEAFAARLDPDWFDLSAVIDAADFTALGESLHRRSPRRILVQVEARPARRRLRRHVRAARAREAVLLLFGLHVRLLDRRSGRGRRAAPGRQGLFGDHRRGGPLARSLRAQPHHRPLRPGARGGEEPGAGDRLRRDRRVEAAQVGRSYALPADRPHPARQARQRGGSCRDAAAHDRLNAPKRPRSFRQADRRVRPSLKSVKLHRRP
jgi:ATP-dependent DNA ligase